MKKVTKSEFLKKLYDKYGQKFELLDEYVNMQTKIHFQCCDCGSIIFVAPNDLMRHKCGCRTCSIIIKNSPIIGVNDLWTTHPHIAKLLKDPNDGYKYSAGSNKKVWFKCPICGNESEKFIYAVINYGFSCNKCSDGISYPNKFFRNFFNQLNILYEPEWDPDFIRPMAYDFYFEFKGKHYIVEADGGLGHGNQRDTSMAKHTKEESIEIDNYKDNMALQHGIHVIRIDCNYSNFSDRDIYIKNNIINSELSMIFDLSSINWDECDQFATSSLIYKVAELWDSGLHTAKEIANVLNLTTSCVISYLKKSEQFKISSYVHNDYIKQSYIQRNKNMVSKTSIAIRCIETREVFSSISEANKKYHCSIYDYFYGKCKYAGMLSDGTKLHWEKVYSS